ncbi:MAG: oligosaccharyl transferase, archaeosortase A system-associated [Methanotrichaceae archaeon]
MSKRSVDKGNKGKEANEPKAAEVPLKTSKGPVKEAESGLKADLYWYAGLFLAFLFSLYLRVVRPMGSVFVGDTVRFSSETDAWYHMMLAKGTIINLQRLWYDPMTNFPYGTALHFGPFNSWTIAIFSYIFGLGHPSAHLIEVIGALLPAVLGALLVFPVYQLGKELGGKSTGLISALIIAVLPGTLLARTTLGFVDHHAAETFLSALTMAFFLMAMRSGKGMTLASVQKSWSDFKMPLLYSALAGISLGLYIDAWSSGFLFEGIILAFILIQSVTDHLKDRSVEYLSISGAITFFVATLLVLPFVKLYNGFSDYFYSLFHPTILILGVIAVVLISFLARFLAKKEINRYYYPGVLAGIAVLGTLILTLIVPQFTRPLFYSLMTMFQERIGGAETVGEASPFFEYGGEPSMANMQLNFPPVANIIILSPFFLAIAALVVLLVRYIRNDQKPTDLAIITWSVIILVLTLAQNRFAYYYGVNVAILTGFLAVWVLQKVGFNELDKWDIDTKDTAKLLNNSKVLLVAVVIFLVAIFPNLQMSMAVSQYPSTLYGEYPDWITSANWLKDNTPSPGMELYKIYTYPPSGKYSYPDTAYGVMSWWDYGHIIETIGDRLPNANPFQEGIGSVTKGIPGSSPFFLAENESQAEKVLANLDKGRSPYMNTRYIMIDWEMATGKFYAMTAWSSIPINKYYGVFYQLQGDQPVPVSVFRDPFFKTMIARLFYFDGSETPVTDAIGIAYRIADQDGMKFSVILDTPKISKNYTELLDYVKESKEKGYLSEIVSKKAYTSLTTSVPLEALQHYRLVHESESVVTYDGQKDVKTFEHVPGAVIKGTAPAGTKVLIGVPIKTNTDREFNYIQSNTTDSKGVFTLVVPYSTEGPASWGTKFDTAPAGPYQLVVGDKVYEIKVPEEYVMSGSVITVG